MHLVKFVFKGLFKSKSLFKSQEIARYMKNSAWMLAEYILKIFSAIFVGIYVARYLGPEQFGILSYALAISSIMMAVGRLGMESVLVRDLAQHPYNRLAYMGTAFRLMLTVAIVGMLVMGALVIFWETDYNSRICILIISLGALFQAFSVIDYNFQSQVRAKYSTLAKSLALSLTSIVKLVMVWSGAELVHFAVVYALDYAAIGFFLVVFNFKKEGMRFIGRFETVLLKPLLKSAWPMVLSAVSAILYMRVDQLMIKNMLGLHELGLYAAAVKIYEGWVVVPYVISISLLPAIVKIKSRSISEYEKNMAMLFSLMFWSGACIALIATFLGDQLILLSFGSEYLGSGGVLAIVMWAAAFASLGSITARYLTVEGMERKIAIRTFLGLAINIALNILLIPLYGIKGAAIATLVTMFFSNFAINYTDRSLTQLVRICNSSLTLRWLAYEK